MLISGTEAGHIGYIRGVLDGWSPCHMSNLKNVNVASP